MREEIRAVMEWVMTSDSDVAKKLRLDALRALFTENPLIFCGDSIPEVYDSEA